MLNKKRLLSLKIIKQFLESGRYRHSRKNEKSEGQLMFLEPNIQHDGDR